MDLRDVQMMLFLNIRNLVTQIATKTWIDRSSQYVFALSGCRLLYSD